jgi:hypothetical protein
MLEQLNGNEVLALQTAPADKRCLCVAAPKHQVFTWSMPTCQADRIWIAPRPSSEQTESATSKS